MAACHSVARGMSVFNYPTPKDPLVMKPFRHRLTRSQIAVDLLEDRCVPATISITDSSAIEGGVTLNLLDRFVSAGSGGIARPRSVLFGPDGNGDGIQDFYIGDIDNNAILRYDGLNGSFMDTFVSPNSGGLNSPGDLAFGHDNNLYVTSYESNQLLRYNGSTGAFLDVVANGLSSPLGLTVGNDGSLYIANEGSNEILRYANSALTVLGPAGSGGLNKPRNAVNGPDGNLYVASALTSQVLRYNGQTGAYIDVFASPIQGQGAMLWLEFGTDGYLYTTARTSTVG